MNWDWLTGFERRMAFTVISFPLIANCVFSSCEIFFFHGFEEEYSVFLLSSISQFTVGDGFRFDVPDWILPVMDWHQWRSTNCLHWLTHSVWIGIKLPLLKFIRGSVYLIGGFVVEAEVTFVDKMNLFERLLQCRSAHDCTAYQSIIFE